MSKGIWAISKCHICPLSLELTWKKKRIWRSRSLGKSFRGKARKYLGNCIYGRKMHDTLCTTATLTQECIKMKEFVIFLLGDVEEVLYYPKKLQNYNLKITRQIDLVFALFSLWMLQFDKFFQVKLQFQNNSSNWLGFALFSL